MKTTNNESESPFVGLIVIEQHQTFNHVDLHAADGVSNFYCNGYFHFPTTKKKIEKDKFGIFRKLPEELQIAIMMTAMEQDPSTRLSNAVDLDAQKQVKRENYDSDKANTSTKENIKYIEALKYFEIFDADACWKTIQSVNKNFKLLTTKKAMYKALKNNINICMKGFGLHKYHFHWSKNGNKLPIESLKNHWLDIICKEKGNTPTDQPLMTAQAL